MSRIELIGSLIVTWGAFRLLAGRATLATRDFALVFVLGATASTAFALAGERIARAATSWDRVTSVYAGPIEEVAKALPLALVVAAYTGRRRLSLADWSLVGLAGGAGFTFVQWALESTIPETDPGAPLAWHRWLLGSRSEHVYGNAVFVGAASTVLVGLCAGLGLRFLRTRAGALVGLVGLAIAAVDNGAYRYAVGPLASGNNSSFAHVPGTLGSLHAVLLHGRLEVYLVTVGLVAALWIEGRWVLHTNPDPRRVLLAEEATVPLVVAEWIVAARRLREGWSAFAKANAYFRARREFGLLVAQHASAEARAARARVIWLRAELDVPAARASYGLRPLQALAGALVLALFLVDPITAPHAVRSVLFADGFAAALAVTAFALSLLRVATAWRFGFFERLTAWTAVPLSLLALVGLGVSLPNVMPDYDSNTGVFDPFYRWLHGSGYPAYGGNAHTLFAAAAFLCVAASAHFAPVWRRTTQTERDVPEAPPTVAGV